MLSDLIEALSKNNYFLSTKEIIKNLKKIKDQGNKAVHNYKITLNKDKIDNLKDPLLDAVKELVSSIDYRSWN